MAKRQREAQQSDADFLLDDPMMTRKVAVKIDRNDPEALFNAIDELRQEALDAKGRDYRIYREVRAIRQALQDANERLGDTGLNKKIDERIIGNVKSTASKWGATFIKRALIISGGLTGIAGGIWWVVKMVWKGVHAQ